MIFIIHEPITELNKVYEQVALRRPRRGRKRNPDIKRLIKKINPITVDETKIVRDDNTELVYLHTLYSQVYQKRLQKSNSLQLIYLLCLLELFL